MHTDASALPSALAQINVERQASGASSLAFDDCLNALASARAADMVTRGYFSHRTPDGRLPWDIMRSDGCSFHYAAENIAEAPDALHAISELWQSPEHRTNTLGIHFRKIGLGFAFRPDGA